MMLEMDRWISKSKPACCSSYRHSSSGTKSIPLAEPGDNADVVVSEQEAAVEAAEAVEVVEAAEVVEAIGVVVKSRSPSRGGCDVGNSRFRGASSSFVSRLPWPSWLGIAMEEDGGWQFFAFFTLMLSAGSSELLSRLRLILVPGNAEKPCSIRQVQRTAHLRITRQGCRDL